MQNQNHQNHFKPVSDGKHANSWQRNVKSSHSTAAWHLYHDLALITAPYGFYAYVLCSAAI